MPGEVSAILGALPFPTPLGRSVDLAPHDPVSRAEICLPPSACQFAGMEPAPGGKRATRTVLGVAHERADDYKTDPAGTPGDASHAA